ncbi:MAG TPA: hypothetical protein VGP94_10285 [Tepidisphaeraceae bacterium]|jgi:hypothetical protein|nr:hypothetical protein [Tepidisphaeraceae bacterium]
METDDLPKDLTFNDPAITAPPVKVSVPHQPKHQIPSTPLGKLRDFVIGLLLLAAFFGALYALSLLITGARGK